MKDIAEDFLNQILEACPDVDRKKLLTTIQEGIAFYQEQAEKYANGPLEHRLGIVDAYYNKVDNSLKERPADLLSQIQCRKGCAHCCKIKVECSLLEAEYIYEYCKEEGITFDVERLKEQAKLDDVNEYTVSPFRNCVFLGEDNACKIYEARPIACRNYLVVSDPAHCDVQNGVRKVLAVATLDENLVGAGLSLASKEFGSLPEMLLVIIKRNGYK